jgi:ribonucleotide monophosphatase NagD (HAD superfamily)
LQLVLTGEAVIEDEWPARERGPNRLPGLLIDLDGVIYQSERIIDGALQTLDWIRQRQIPHLFVTNTTSRSRVALLEKFEHFGFAAELDELMTPIVAANQYIERRQFGRIAAFVTASAASEFSEVEVVAPQSAQAVDAVVIGDLGEAWDYRDALLARRRWTAARCRTVCQCARECGRLQGAGVWKARGRFF